MDQKHIENLQKQITELSDNAKTAVDAARASASIAYKASVENVNVIKELRGDIKEMSLDVKANLIQSTETKGRVGTLEDWSKEAKQLIEINSRAIINYEIDKAKLWVAYISLFLLGGTIITLAIMAIDSKIKNDITTFNKTEIIK